MDFVMVVNWHFSPCDQLHRLCFTTGSIKLNTLLDFWSLVQGIQLLHLWYRAGAYGAAGTAMAVPLFWSRRTILRVKIEKMEWVGYGTQIFHLRVGGKK